MNKYKLEDTLSKEQLGILKIVQETLPDSPMPFAEIAQSLQITEEEVLTFLNSLKEKGYIRRFGATLRHQEAGYGANVMVAWEVQDETKIEKIAEQMISSASITHCYQRISHPLWPYNLYTMVHGRNKKECLQVIKELAKATGVTNYEMLFSDQELKKTSMHYF